MFVIFIVFAIVYVALSFGLGRCSQGFRLCLAWASLVVWGLTLSLFSNPLTPWRTFFCSLIGTFWVGKLAARVVEHSAGGKWLGFRSEVTQRFLWPGISVQPFLETSEVDQSSVVGVVRGTIFALLGVSAGLLLARYSSRFSYGKLGTIGLLPIFTVFYFGLLTILPSIIRFFKIPVGQLIKDPFLSVSMIDFWGDRWKDPFVEISRVLFCVGRSTGIYLHMADLGSFVLTGILYELALSLSIRGGYGLPSAYFFFQGILTLLARSAAPRKRIMPLFLRRVGVFCAVIVPLPIAIGPRFRETMIAPLYRDIYHIITAYDAAWVMSVFVVCSVLLLCMSLFVSALLLSSIKGATANLKSYLFLFAGFVFVLTIAFIISFIAGASGGANSSIALIGIALGFWLIRLALDLVSFFGDQWPGSPTFVFSHLLLNFVFLFFTLAQGGVLLTR